MVTGTVIRSQRTQTPTPLASKVAGTSFQPAVAASLSHLQDIVRTGNRTAIAGVVNYPLRVSEASGTRLYPQPAAVRDDFDRIFTPRVTRAILGQKASRPRVRNGKVFIEGSVVSFAATCLVADCSRVGPLLIDTVRP